jgi:hypothetical protein
MIGCGALVRRFFRIAATFVTYAQVNEMADWPLKRAREQGLASVETGASLPSIPPVSVAVLPALRSR